MKTKIIINILHMSLLIITLSGLYNPISAANEYIENNPCAEDAMLNVNNPSLEWDYDVNIGGEDQVMNLKIYNLPEHSCSSNNAGYFGFNANIVPEATINNLPLQNRWIKSVEDGPVTIDLEFDFDRDDFMEQGYSAYITYTAPGRPPVLLQDRISIDGNWSFEWNPRLGSEKGFIWIRIDVIGLSSQDIDPQQWSFHIPTSVEGPTSLTAPVIDVTQTPIIPRMILYKPPGDLSSSTFITETEICREFSTSFGSSNTFSNDSDLTVGYSGSVGAVVEVDVEVGVTASGGFESSETQTSTTTAETCNTITSEFVTSDIATSNATDSDLIIGMSKQQMIAKGNFISVNDECAFETKPRLYVYYVGDGSIIVSQTRNQILATIEEFAQDSIAARVLGNTISPEELKISVERNIQLSVYRQLIRQLKESEASGFGQQPTPFPPVQAGVADTREFTMTTTESFTFEYESVATETAGLEGFASVAGNGFSNTSVWEWEETHGSSTTNETSETEIIAYTVQDEEDDIAYLRYTNPKFGSPMFRIAETSETSCPYEGGVRKFQPRIEVLVDNICPVVLADLNQPYLLPLELCNDASSSQIYRLSLGGNTAGGLNVKDGGTILGTGESGAVGHTIPAEDCITVNVTLEPSLANTHSLEFLLSPECFDNETNINERDAEGTSAFFDIEFQPGANPVDTDNDGINECDLCPMTKNAALDFDGINDYITIPHDIKHDLIGFEIWVAVKIEHQIGKNIIFTKGVNNIEYQIYITSSDHPTPNVAAIEFPSLNEEFIIWRNIPLPENQWVNLSFIYRPESNKVSIGVDDTKFRTLSNPVSNIVNRPISSEDLQIGNGFKGQMDNFMIWDKDLDDLQEDLVNSRALSGDEDGLVAYYNFEEGFPCESNPGISTVIDQVPNGIDGDMYNFSVSSSTCTSNWTTSMNRDFDGNGIGDNCDPIDLCVFEDVDGDGFDDCTDLCIDESDRSLWFRDGYAQIPHHKDFNITDGDFAFEAWVHSVGVFPFNDDPILFKGTGVLGAQTQYYFRADDLGISLYLSDGVVGEWQFSENGLTGSAWHHVAVSVDNSGAFPIATFYIDGVEKGVKSYTTLGSLYNNDMTPLYVGGARYAQRINRLWDALDEVAIWNKTLAADDISASMMNTHTGTESHLVAYYGFNEAVECLELTDIVNGHHGTLTNVVLQQNGCALSWQPGHNKGGCGPMYCDSSVDADGDAINDCVDLCLDVRDVSLHFEAADFSDYVEVPHHADFNLTAGDFAFEAWINPASGDYKTIVSKGNGGNASTDFNFSINADTDPFFNQPGKLGLFLSNGTEAEWQFSSSIIPQNTWTHVAVSIDNAGAYPKATFYVNGVSDGVKTYTTLNSNSLYQGTSPFLIGRQGSVCQCNHFDGRMDKLAVWHRTLTSIDIGASMIAPYSGTENGLVAYYDFNDADACTPNAGNTTLVDKVNNHNGTLQNFSLNSYCRSNWSSGHNAGSCEAIQCPSDVELSGAQSFNVDYESDTYIESNHYIHSSAGIDYDATTEINLLPNFEVQAGSVFHAFIDGCGGNQ